MRTDDNRFWFTFYRWSYRRCHYCPLGPKRREENRKTTGEKGKRLLIGEKIEDIKEQVVEEVKEKRKLQRWQRRNSMNAFT